MTVGNTYNPFAAAAPGAVLAIFEQLDFLNALPPAKLRTSQRKFTGDVQVLIRFAERRPLFEFMLFDTELCVESGHVGHVSCSRHGGRQTVASAGRDGYEALGVLSAPVGLASDAFADLHNALRHLLQSPQIPIDIPAGTEHVLLAAACRLLGRYRLAGAAFADKIAAALDAVAATLDAETPFLIDSLMTSGMPVLMARATHLRLQAIVAERPESAMTARPRTAL